MSEFKNYHPSVNFLYFAAVIVFSMVFMHPVCLLISLICGFVYSGMLGGKKTVKLNLMILLPLVIAASLINPAFNHEGVTILTYLPSGNPLTLESIIYGIAAAVMIASVICWFSCYNKIMTSDKFIYLFGRIIPSLSLILSMTLRFVPRFCNQLKIISASQKCIGRDTGHGGIIKRARNGIKILSVMVTWAFENSIETAQSMKSRGYGLKGRSAFSIFTFSSRDRAALIFIIAVSAYIIFAAALGCTHFGYFPYLKAADMSPHVISAFAAYFLLCGMPFAIEITEVRRWKAIKSKI